MIFGKKPKDDFLAKNLETDRFHLVNCSTKDAIKVTMNWANDPEILRNLMYDASNYSKLDWVKKFTKPDGYSCFYHAILCKETKGTIGVHRFQIDRHDTAHLTFVLHARSRWGQGIFEEVRSAVLDHISHSDRVNRFAVIVLQKNIASLFNAKKLGFKLVGTETEAIKDPDDGTLKNLVRLELLARDWIKIRNSEGI